MKLIWAVALIPMLAALTAGPAAAVSREPVSLNGEWQYVFAEAGSPPGDAAAWQTITIPARQEWRPQGPHCVWYRRAFTVPRDWAGQRVVVRLEGVKYTQQVFVNGKEVGRHTGGYEPTEYDITDLAKPGTENALLVAAQDWTALVLPGTAPASGPDRPESVKDGLIAPVGSYWSGVGLWQGVSLLARPPVWIEDAFVSTSVREHTLKVRVVLGSVANQVTRVTIRPRLVSGGPGPDLGTKTVEVPAQGRALPEFSLSWPDAHLWSPQDPHLYVLRVDAGDDVRSVRFGFREFWTEGTKFLLNGTPIRFLATAAHPLNEYSNDPQRAYAIAKANGCVAMRLHAQPWSQQWYDAADEAGMLLIWESGLWCFTNYALTQDAFWESARAHLAAQMRLHYNNPSVVVWSAENELLHCGGDSIPGTEQHLGELADFMHRFDPTRPVMFDGDEDPAGKADIVNLHYPHEFPRWNLWPETAWWFNDTRQPDVYPRRPWKWDRRKPLYLGEFLWVPADNLDAGSIFFGDAIYPDPAAYHLRAKATAWEMQVIAARDEDVAGLCPWNLWEGGAFPNPGSAAHKYAYQPVAAFVKELGTRAFAGTTAQRTLLVFNDSPQARDLEVRWNLKTTSGTWEANGSQRLHLAPTERAHVVATLPIPAAAVPDAPPGLDIGPFTVEVWEGTQKLFGETQVWQVFRSVDRSRPLVPAPAQHLLLYDPRGETTRALGNLLPLVALTPDNAGQLLLSAKVVAIGKGALTKDSGRIVVGRPSGFYQQLRDFVARGGTLIVFEQEAYPAALLPLALSQHGASIAFVRDRTHPLLQDLTEEDLSHWLPDGVVSRHEIVKPTTGGFRPIVDSGGERGLETAGLAELRLGKGRMILCQLNVTDRVDIEPAAARVLTNLLSYAAAPAAPPRPTAVIAEDAAAATLDAIGLHYQLLTPPLKDSTLRGFGQLLLTDPAQLTGSTALLHQFVAGGGTVVLHGVTPADREAVRALLGQPFVLQPSGDGNVRLADRTGPAAAMSNQDLAWFGPKPNVEYAKPELTSDLADYTLGAAQQQTGPAIRLEAEDLQATAGATQRETLPQGGAALGIYSNGDAVGTITVPAAGRYAFSIRAKGTPALGSYPRVTLAVDGTPFGSVSVGADWQTLSQVGELAAGPHKVKIAFTNDIVVNGEDRNLSVDWVALTPVQAVPTGLRFHTEPGVLASLPEGKGQWIVDQVRWDRRGSNGDKAAHYLATLLTNLGCEFTSEPGEPIEAGQMKATGQIVTPLGDGVAFATNGELTAEVEFATGGRYAFALLASGTPLDSVFPKVELRLDGKTMGAYQLLGPDWQTYRLTVPVTAGQHQIVLAYVNDDSRPPQDRNLSVGRLTIGRIAP